MKAARGVAAYKRQLAETGRAAEGEGLKLLAQYLEQARVAGQAGDQHQRAAHLGRAAVLLAEWQKAMTAGSDPGPASRLCHLWQRLLWGAILERDGRRLERLAAMVARLDQILSAGTEGAAAPAAMRRRA
ncbi:MAG: hypothetical protein AB1634_09050 [Thermodesulfobacteriota bacterium]